MVIAQIGFGLYLVGVAGLGGLVVRYLMRTPRGVRPEGAAWWSGILAALVWPFILATLTVLWLRARFRARRASVLERQERAVSRQVARATLRRMRRDYKRLEVARWR